MLVAGMPPVHRFPAFPQPLRMVLGARATAMDQILRQVAADHDAIHVAMDASTARDPELFAADGFHPSPAGYRIWADNLANAYAPGREDQRAGTWAGTFRTAVEARDLSAITALLDPGVEFHSPVMVKPYHGKDEVAALLRVLLRVFEDFRYTTDLTERNQTARATGPVRTAQRLRRLSLTPGSWVSPSRVWI